MGKATNINTMITANNTGISDKVDPIHVIGLGVADIALLTPSALDALDKASVIIGSKRQLAVIAGVTDISSNVELIVLPKLAALAVLLQEKLALPGQNIVILASGDPLHYGIGRWLINKLGKHRLTFHSGVSSIQAACHLLGLALQDVEVLSLHGRPLAKIRTVLNCNKILVILTDKQSQPQHLAQACIEAGFDESEITVCEQLGYPEQRVRQFTATELLLSTLEFDPLHVSVIKVQGKGHYLPNFPGIEDAHFITGREAGKGMITKREVRLQILSLLQAAKNDVIWDIGAGCGSVAVELAYWQADADIFAIEHHHERLTYLEANKQRFGVVANMQIIAGRAPEKLAQLPAANKVFIGGSDGELAAVLALCWQQLPAGGYLVASAVTENTRLQLHVFAERVIAESDKANIETLQVAVSKGTELAGQLLYKPNYPVTLYKFIK